MILHGKAPKDAFGELDQVACSVMEMNEQWAELREPLGAILDIAKRSPVNLKQLEIHYANDPIKTHEYMKNGRTREITIDRVKSWLQHPERRQFLRIELLPGNTTEGCFNLWQGWAVEPDGRASCDKFLSHTRNIICNGNAKKFDYVIRWLAHAVQKPTELPRVALLLLSEQGAGKNIWFDYIAKLYGKAHAGTVERREDLVGPYNSYWAHWLMIGCDEAFYGGAKRDEGALKALITNPKRKVSEKFRVTYEIDNYSRFIFMSNEDWALPIAIDDRRFFVLRLDNKYATKRNQTSEQIIARDAYFRDFLEESRGDGPAALMEYLSDVDLEGFDPGNRPLGLSDSWNTKYRSLNSFDKFWYELLSALCVKLGKEGYLNFHQEMNKKLLYDAYEQFVARQRYSDDPLNRVHFWRAVHAMNIWTKDKSKKRGVRTGGGVWKTALRSLAECRTAYEQHVAEGPHIWEEAEQQDAPESAHDAAVPGPQEVSY